MVKNALNQTQMQAAVAAIREELARRRLSRPQAAALARIGVSTLEKVLNGSRPLTMATLIRLEQALGLSLRTPAGALAPPELGGYGREAVRWLEGDFLTLRSSFECLGAIFAYRTVISWDAATPCLRFREEGRLDPQYAQSGTVSVPFAAGHIYLQNNMKGEIRLAVLSRPVPGGALYGLLTTLRANRGPALLPVSVPLALLPFAEGMALGQIAPEAPDHAAYRAHLERVTADGFAAFPAV